MASKTTTTTVVHSEKDSDGNWSEFSKTVTTVVERDDDGYPYGPIPYVAPGSGRHRKPGSLGNYGYYGDYLAWYNSIGARPAAKKKPEDGQND